ncbi:hypothetical protein [Sabulicella glaciei]|uniref:Uncharacterized protein n=1 Tax=Sabulicella glaciei TaxID=2984948 RepID=A0ABT3NS87_9PROT|nr:hypothetical protein [Roseococcus sp. MDT2-1-1]MCW8085017.1 hypothetical protein [Roseococcus sp. MDT2-1-1]
MLQQACNQDLKLKAARQDLACTLARGDAKQLATADLELQNAGGKLCDLEQDLAQAEVSGVVLMPPERRKAEAAGRIRSRPPPTFRAARLCSPCAT